MGPIRAADAYAGAVANVGSARASLASRLWVYQWERIPVLMIAVMAFGLTSAISQVIGSPAWDKVAITTLIVVLYMVEIRTADEPKDFAHDNLYYPTRPVQRGLVTLRELLWVRNFAIVASLIPAVLSGSKKVLAIALLLQVYAFLTRREFFVREWLRAHFFLYQGTHYVQLLILNWLLLTVLGVPNKTFGLAFGFAILMVGTAEVARKTREVTSDHADDTYSAHLGRAGSVSAYWAVAIALSVVSLEFVRTMSDPNTAILLLPVGLAFAIGAGVAYVRSPNVQRTKLLQSSAFVMCMCAAASTFLAG